MENFGATSAKATSKGGIMFYDDALEKAKRQAKNRNRVYYVCYHEGHSSPDWKQRYIVSEYLSYPAAYPESVKAQAFPAGNVQDANGNPIIDKGGAI